MFCYLYISIHAYLLGRLTVFLPKELSTISRTSPLGSFMFIGYHLFSVLNALLMDTVQLLNLQGVFYSSRFVIE